MTLRFVAVNYRSADELPGLLDSLFAQSSPQWTLTVVDNSEDPAQAQRLHEILEGHPRTEVLVAPRNLGYMNALAYAVAHGTTPAPGDWLALTNMDLALRSTDFVERVIARDDADLGCLAPAIISTATGRDQNPYHAHRPSRRLVAAWKLMWANDQVGRMGVAGLNLLARRRKSSAQAAPATVSGADDVSGHQVDHTGSGARSIYGPHGSLLLLSPSYLAAGGAVDHPVWLFGEEITVAEECARLGLRVDYDPSLVAEHREHVSTGLWRSMNLITAQSDSVRYILDRLNGQWPTTRPRQDDPTDGGLRLTALMTVYHGTSLPELERSMECLLGQTRPADELLVVLDGPVEPEVDAALERYAAVHATVRIQRLPVNGGSGVASNHGLALATGELVARHDSDDISLPHRFETQLAALHERGLDLVGSAMLEFEGDPEQVRGIRANPTNEVDIRRRARINNPINNPTALFRRQLALDVGGYSDLRFMQDYDLFVRMLAAGARVENLAEPLVLFNAGDSMLARRSGKAILQLEGQLQRRFVEAGFISRPMAARNLVLRSGFRLIPATALRRVYRTLFVRKHEV